MIANSNIMLHRKYEKNDLADRFFYNKNVSGEAENSLF